MSDEESNTRTQFDRVNHFDHDTKVLMTDNFISGPIRKGVINSETMGYFLARIQQYLWVNLARNCGSGNTWALKWHITHYACDC